MRVRQGTVIVEPNRPIDQPTKKRRRNNKAGKRNHHGHQTTYVQLVMMTETKKSADDRQVADRSEVRQQGRVWV